MKKFCKFGKLQATSGNGEKLLKILLKASEQLKTVDSYFWDE